MKTPIEDIQKVEMNWSKMSSQKRLALASLSQFIGL